MLEVKLLASIAFIILIQLDWQVHKKLNSCCQKPNTGGIY